MVHWHPGEGNTMTTYKKALVTGCGRGIGAAVARELAARSLELIAINRSRGSTCLSASLPSTGELPGPRLTPT
jgi:NAD(P)-dependent dehydrogenase (short-subunit alcohol dehydrogenase family)